ncbi:hypothetical protein KEJ45_03830 [Candidatus Bathyarchaeota archaeon]|nr:hypothetical protein [Candidatus Bathyarchaeota archaeon]
MNLPIRAIGIATTLLWVFLIAFFASAVYSLKDLRFDIGEPHLSVSDGEAFVYIPICVDNKGSYNLSAFNLSTSVKDANGSTLSESSTFLPVIKSGEKTEFLHNLTFNLEDLLSNGEYYLFNDADLLVTASIGVKIAEAIPVRASTNFSLPWGAPFYNFELGEPSIENFNLTHINLIVPLGFENHSFFDVQGEIKVRMYDVSGALIGEGETTVNVPQHSFYTGHVSFCIEAEKMPSNGFFEVYFTTAPIIYGPMVVPYG